MSNSENIVCVASKINLFGQSLITDGLSVINQLQCAFQRLFFSKAFKNITWFAELRYKLNLG